MEKNEIIEGNKLIAEFMGWTIEEGMENEENPFYNHTSEEGFMPKTRLLSQLCFHTSWDWLHPVYMKVQDELTSQEGVLLFNEMFHGAIVFNNIKWVHGACFECIKWYNQQLTTK